MESVIAPYCKFLPWDSEFFGFNIARVMAERLVSEKHVDQVFAWCQENEIDVAYFLAVCDDACTVALAGAHGFFLTDVRVTLRWDGKRKKETLSIPVRQACCDDRPALEAIARGIYTDSRFYFDPGFPRDRCDDLYVTWIRLSCEDYADAVLVTEREGEIAGFVTCHLKETEGVGEIGLIGVAESARGMGFGQGIVRTALDWFVDQGIETVDVVTQGRNIAAQRLYQRCGFMTHTVQLWYHKWFENCRQERVG
jgi:ribosomal protein S18 acetylase RimI-like enzyme